MLAHIARTYDRSYGHFTTRQNIQYNWPALERVPISSPILASVEMHAIQTSGKLHPQHHRHHLAGVAPDEIADPRPYCEIIRQWATLNPEFSYLPRKFKIAVTASPADRAAVEIHDVGVRIKHGRTAAIGFEILAGGGLGRTPILGKLIRSFPAAGRSAGVPGSDPARLQTATAGVTTFHKARIKILVRTLGAEELRARWSRNSRPAANLRRGSKRARWSACALFAPRPYQQLKRQHPRSRQRR